MVAQGYKFDVLYGASVIHPVLAARICPSPSRWLRLLDGLHYWLLYWPAHRLRVWRLRRRGASYRRRTSQTFPVRRHMGDPRGPN